MKLLDKANSKKYRSGGPIYFESNDKFIFTQQAMMVFMLIMQMIYSANGIITEWFLHEKVMIVSGLQVS